MGTHEPEVPTAAALARSPQAFPHVEITGFVPVQAIEWLEGEPTETWQLYVILAGPRMLRLLALDTFGSAIHLAGVLNASIERARELGRSSRSVGLRAV